MIAFRCGCLCFSYGWKILKRSVRLSKCNYSMEWLVKKGVIEESQWLDNLFKYPAYDAILNRILSYENQNSCYKNNLIAVQEDCIILEYLEKNLYFRNSCHKNWEFFFTRTRVLASRQWSRECLIANPIKRITISNFLREEAESLS